MSIEDSDMLDTRDMVAVHNAIKSALGTSSQVIPAISNGDLARAEQIAAYLSEALWLLHAHHDGEDDLMYPLLLERASESVALFNEMDAQHIAVTSELERAQHACDAFAASGSSADGEALVSALAQLQAIFEQHAGAEENEVLPIAARTLSPPEWGALPGHALGSYRGERMWLPLGMVLEAMPMDVREATFAHMPVPVVEMWTGFGAQAYQGEMKAIRG